MGKQTARKGDPTSHGGTIIGGSPLRKVNGKDIARIGDMVSCPLPGHGTNPITTGSSNVKVDGKFVAWVGSQTACGAVITSGSSDVQTN